MYFFSVAIFKKYSFQHKLKNSATNYFLNSLSFITTLYLVSTCQNEFFRSDESVVSVGIRQNGSCNLEKLNAWIAKLIREQGVDLFRYKGVLSVVGAEEKFIFQGVHMVFEGKPAIKWKEGEVRENKMIFIGRNLNKEALEKGFNDCLEE